MRCARRTCRSPAARSASRRVDMSNAFQLSLQMKGRLLDADEFENIIVKMGDDGRVVRVKDIGRVELGALSYTTTAIADSYPAIVLIVDQQPGSNALDDGQRHQGRHGRALPSASPRASSTASSTIRPSSSRSRSPSSTAPSSRRSRWSCIVVLLFLKTWRATVIPLVAIPVSLIGTFAVMQALGFSHQHADAVRPGAGGRHRRRRRHRRGRERRAQAAARGYRRRRLRASPWTRSARR